MNTQDVTSLLKDSPACMDVMAECGLTTTLQSVLVIFVDAQLLPIKGTMSAAGHAQ